MGNLLTLGLSNNQFLSVPPEIGNLANLQHLAFDNNQLTGTIPKELATW